MACINEERISITKGFRTPEEKYSRCRLLNVIQHIDIYGKSKPIYSESKLWKCQYETNHSQVTSISTSPTKIETEKDSTGTSIDSKLSRLSVTTKVSGLYPGYDMMSKRARRNKQSKISKTVLCNVFIPR